MTTRNEGKKVPFFKPTFDFDDNLSEHEQIRIFLKQALEYALNIRQPNESSLGRQQHKHAVQTAIDRLVTLQLPDVDDSFKFQENPAKHQLELQERKLRSLIASMESELIKWKKVEFKSKNAPIFSIDMQLPSEDTPLEDIPDVSDVLQSSKKAIESYVLHTDQAKLLVKLLETRSSKAATCVHDIASKLNERVINDFCKPGDSSENLTLPPVFATVRTKSPAHSLANTPNKQI